MLRPVTLVTWRNILEHAILHSHRRENLKCDKKNSSVSQQPWLRCVLTMIRGKFCDVLYVARSTGEIVYACYICYLRQESSCKCFNSGHNLAILLLYSRSFIHVITTQTNKNVMWRMVSSEMLRRVALVRTDISEEPGASFIRVTRIDELGTTQAATSCEESISSQGTSVASCSLCCS
jgi:hypothetical protein